MTHKQIVQDALLSYSCYGTPEEKRANKALEALPHLYDKAELIEMLEASKLKRPVRDEHGFIMNLTDEEIAAYNACSDTIIKELGG